MPDVRPATYRGDLVEKANSHAVRQRDEDEVHPERVRALKLERHQERDRNSKHRHEHLQNEQSAHEIRIESRRESIHAAHFERRDARDISSPKKIKFTLPIPQRLGKNEPERVLLPCL